MLQHTSCGAKDFTAQIAGWNDTQLSSVKVLPPVAKGYRDDTDGSPLQTALTRQRVFVVEDEALISMYLCERLTALGYFVCGTASSGEIALASIVNSSPDILLMDVSLSGPMDGVESAIKIRERHNVPVVFLTAYSDPELISRASQAGGYGYLVKPFDERELHATLQVALARAEAHAELERRVAHRTAELSDSLAAMESFSHTVAHDLRGPLLALSLYADLVLEEQSGRVDAEIAILLRRIRDRLNHMSALTGKLLDFATATKGAVRREPLVMRQLAADVVSELTSQSCDRSVDFQVGDLPEANGDAILIGQVWRNLLGNALKFSASRDPAQIRAGYDLEKGAWYVRDNGVGFDMNQAGKLFQPFSRIHTGLQIEGFGIGLAMVERIVRRHGGRVWAESSPGNGATFYFTLPVSV